MYIVVYKLVGCGLFHAWLFWLNGIKSIKARQNQGLVYRVFWQLVIGEMTQNLLFENGSLV